MRDICERLGWSLKKDKWNRLLGKATRALGIEEPLKKKLKCLYRDFCTVAHAEREATPTPQKVRKDFHETLSALEELYERLAKKVQSDGA